MKEFFDDDSDKENDNKTKKWLYRDVDQNMECTLIISRTLFN